MKIYRWKSETLRNYAFGYILAIGNDVDDARCNAREQFSRVVRDRWSWLTDLDEDDLQEIEEKLAFLEHDIQGEPEVDDTFFIPGSD